jgi:hypothetical protein
MSKVKQMQNLLYDQSRKVSTRSELSLQQVQATQLLASLNIKQALINERQSTPDKGQTTDKSSEKTHEQHIQITHDAEDAMLIQTMRHSKPSVTASTGQQEILKELIAFEQSAHASFDRSFQTTTSLRTLLAKEPSLTTVSNEHTKP